MVYRLRDATQRRMPESDNTIMITSLLNVLDLVAFGMFAVSYYRNCYRKGYRMDFWHAQLVTFCVVPYMLMFPLAANPLNAAVVTSDFNAVVAATPIVFLAAMVGYFSLFAGGMFWKLHLGIGLRRKAGRALDFFPRCSLMLMSSPEMLVFLSGICVMCQMTMLILYFSSEGFGFNVRGYTFENPSIRPFSNITALSSMVVASHCLARYVEKREKSVLACACLLIFGLLFFGQRGNVIFAILNVWLCYVIQRRDSISMFRSLAIGLSSILVILYFGNLREGEYSPAAFFTSLAFLIFFGNNLCDLRDFAWLYARWDHHYWMGKTYLAGLMNYLPRSVSDFRATWTFGIATGRTVGLDTDIHPGLKPGQFGEAFLNFGWVGVLLFGIIMGVITRRADDGVKAEFLSRRPSFMAAFAYTLLLPLAAIFNTSAAFPAFWALLGLYFLAWLYLRVRALAFPSQIALARAQTS